MISKQLDTEAIVTFPNAENLKVLVYKVTQENYWFCTEKQVRTIRLKPLSFIQGEVSGHKVDVHHPAEVISLWVEGPMSGPCLGLEDALKAIKRAYHAKQLDL